MSTPRRAHRVRVLGAALAAALAAPAPVDALPVDVPLRALALDHFTERDGLPQNAVRALLHGAGGELWVATDEGLGRYDGAGWTRVDRAAVTGLGSNLVSALAQTADGTMWIGTYDAGLVRRHDGGFSAVAIPGAPAGLSVRALAPDAAGGLWVATASGVFHLTGDRVESYTMADGLPDDRAIGVAVDRDGAAWVGLHRGVARIEGGKVHGGPPALAGSTIRGMVADPAGGLWIGTTDRGVAHVGADGVRFVGTAQGLPSPTVTSLALDRDGWLWIGLQTAGLARLRDDRLERLGSREGLAGDWISTLLEDGEGSLWVGTQDAGLIRLRTADFVTSGAAEGLSHDAVEAVLETRGGDLWLATDGGVDVLPGGRWPARRIAVEAPMSLLQDRAGAVYVGTFGRGLWRWRDGALARLPDRLPPHTWIRALAEDQDGVVWAATTHGLYRLVADALVPVGDGLPPERPAVEALVATPAGLFVATEGKGVFRRGGGRFVREEAGPPDAWVVSAFLADADGTIWMATEGGGLWRRRGGAYARVSAAEGLPADTLWTILDDRRGALWLTGNRGVARVDRAHLDEVLDGRAQRLRVRTWSREDGLRTAEATGLSHPAAARAADGRLWFATPRGASVIDPGRLRPDPPPPETALHAVVVDRAPQHSETRVALGPDARRLGIEFGARVLLAQPRATYRYRLHGLEHGWTEARGRGDTQYTFLPPGTYRFEVQSRIGDGPWGPLRTLEIVQEPPAWRTPAALAGLGLAALALATGLAALLRRRVRAQGAAAEAALREARAEVAALSALLPRCGWCRGERHDPAYLAAVDAAMRARPAAQFDAGRCPACAARGADAPAAGA